MMPNNFLTSDQIGKIFISHYKKLEKMKRDDPKEYERYTKQLHDDEVRARQNAPCHCCGRSRHN
jgi:hypothetical protein